MTFAHLPASPFSLEYFTDVEQSRNCYWATSLDLQLPHKVTLEGDQYCHDCQQTLADLQSLCNIDNQCPNLAFDPFYGIQ
jgi:hypothetical protein